MNLVGSVASRTMSAVSRISRIGSSRASFNSDWKPLPIFFSSAYVLPNCRIASGSFSGPSTTSASSRITMISLPWRLNTRAVYGPGHHLLGVQQRLPSLLDPPIAFAHRGARAHAPENTIEAFELALRLGATGLESDVWLTADGVPVLDHDGVVQRSAAASARSASCAAVELPAHIPSLGRAARARVAPTTTCRSTSRTCARGAVVAHGARCTIRACSSPTLAV